MKELENMIYNLVKAAETTEQLNEIRDKYGYDLYIEAICRVSEEKREKTIDELWMAACSGDIETLREYYGNGGKENRRYNKFLVNHSLIAGAYRNGQIETVKYLYSIGEIPEAHEMDEIPFSDLVSYNVVINRIIGKMEILGFKEHENALYIFSCMCEIAGREAENIASVELHVLGKPVKVKRF